MHVPCKWRIDCVINTNEQTNTQVHENISGSTMFRHSTRVHGYEDDIPMVTDVPTYQGNSVSLCALSTLTSETRHGMTPELTQGGHFAEQSLKVLDIHLQIFALGFIAQQCVLGLHRKLGQL